MADMLARASEWLDGQRVRHLCRPISYHRGAEAVEVQAAVGRTVFEVADTAGGAVLEEYECRDYIVRAADLPFTPERGDRVMELQDGVRYIYEVMAPGREPAARFADVSRRTWRIHTKLVAVET